MKKKCLSENEDLACGIKNIKEIKRKEKIGTIVGHEIVLSVRDYS